jgi:hypothetical protein
MTLITPFSYKVFIGQGQGAAMLMVEGVILSTGRFLP